MSIRVRLLFGCVRRYNTALMLCPALFRGRHKQTRFLMFLVVTCVCFIMISTVMQSLDTSNERSMVDRLQRLHAAANITKATSTNPSPCPKILPDPPVVLKPIPSGERGVPPKLPLCPTTPDKLNLKGPILVNYTIPTWHDLELQNPDLEPGGKWRPDDCIPRHNVAIVVPYRDREKQLLLFLQHMHPFLKKQKIAYTIYVLEQAPGKVFNRGLDRNIGFVQSLSFDPSHECTMFHDVDLLPLDERNMYTCPDQPRHVCVAVNYYKNYRPLYLNTFAEFGHVTFFRNDHFRLINGYSNLYLGWGAEDDDIHSRVKSRGMHVYRYPDKIARYYGIPHQDESTLPRPISLAQNVSRFKLLNVATERLERDGLSNLRYNISRTVRGKLLTHIVFDVDENSYAKQAIEEENLYKTLYGNLSPYWKHLPIKPSPFWWLNETQYKLLGSHRVSKSNRKKKNRFWSWIFG